MENNQEHTRHLEDLAALNPLNWGIRRREGRWGEKRGDKRLAREEYEKEGESELGRG